MKLAFKRRWGLGYIEKEVPVIFNIGTLEAVCLSLEIEFHEITSAIKKNNIDFVIELLWQGYITACKENYRKPKYKKVNSFIWYEQMSKSAQNEFRDMMTDLFGRMTKKSKKKEEKSD